MKEGGQVKVKAKPPACLSKQRDEGKTKRRKELENLTKIDVWESGKRKKRPPSYK
jgi:hypothetical protein